MRELEQRARDTRSDEAPRPRARRRTQRVHPDQQAAIAEIADRLEIALGRSVQVTASGGGYRAQLDFVSADEALDLARSLRLDPSA